MYVVVRCPRCGSLMLAKRVHKTRTCPQCSYRTTLRGLKVLRRTDSSRKALTLIQALKEKDSRQKETSI